MSHRSRAWWSLALALVAHALVIVWTAHRSPSKGGAPSDVQPLEVSVTVEPAPPPVEPPVEAPPTSALAPVTASPNVVARPTTSEPSATMDSVPTPVMTAEPSSGQSWTFAPTSSSAQVAGDFAAHEKALHDATASGVGAVLAEAEKKAADRARKPLILTSRDLGLGLVPGSQYASLVRDRVRNSTAPIEGHALLEFWTDRRGVVARVRVLNASSDPRMWDDVAEALAEDARSSFPLKIPSNADGLIVTLDVTSALKTLSGSSANEGSFARALGALTDPVDTLIDSKSPPRRVVAAKVVSVEAF